MKKKDSLDLRDRHRSFAEIEAQRFDILIIGAGITGCGVARDAAMRGLTVALVDAGDIGAGTSSRSSKLIHGGIRYLAEGHVGVVREAAVERKNVRRIAPHLAQTTNMLVPASSKTGISKLKAGLVVYEKLGQIDQSERHDVWPVDRVKQEEPRMVTARLAGAVVYPEYLTDDARLTLANARSAASHGAHVITYARVEDVVLESGKAVGAVVRGVLPGEDRRALVRARVVVNAAGPWVDAIRHLEDRNAEKKLQLTKGIHLVVAHDRLPIGRTIIITAPDRRSIFAIPRDACTYIGTTDTFYQEAEYWPEITREDVDYLLNPVNKVFEIEPIVGEDIIAAWAGLRPLLAAQGKTPSEISRRHEIMEGPGNMLTVAGGKLTSYRSMAERVVDRCQEFLGRNLVSPPTADEPLPGGDFSGTVDALCTRLRSAGLKPEEASRAARLYGGEADVIYAAGDGPAGEVRHAVENEGALTLEDFWIRRSARARFDLDGGVAALAPAAEHISRFFGWTVEERTRQIEACLRLRDSETRAWLEK